MSGGIASTPIPKRKATLLQREILVRATRSRVWSTLVDFDRMHTWFFGVARVAVPPNPGVGTERKLTLLYGKSHRERISEWAEFKFFSLVVVDPPPFVDTWTARIEVEEVVDAVLLRWEMRWEPRRGWGVFDRLLLFPVIDFALRTSLRRFQKKLEPHP